uniref:Ig-like domain-containing protein n=1 Tax=Anas platyrhynchos platyrhynchos TaxID=8840 RepID=U3IJ66_ANAPP
DLDTKNDVIKPPAVAIFSPSKQEIQEKSKATLVCLASGFYPDTLNLVWKVNGAERTEGVGTDETSTSYGDTYSLTSRLRISSQEWFNPLNRFECVNSYLIKATLDQSLLMMIIQYNNDIWFAESYMLHGNSLKLTYLILCGKAFLYAILVCTLMLTAKVGLCITSKVILFTSTSIRQNLLSGMECSPYTLQSYVLPCLKNHKC